MRPDRDRNSANLGHFSSFQAQESNTEEQRKSETVVVVQLVGDMHPPKFDKSVYQGEIR